MAQVNASPAAAAKSLAALLAAPHGSIAAAAVVSSVYLLLAIPVAFTFRQTRFKTYILLLASVLLRGVGFALHGAASAQQDANLEAGFQALRSAGFGMAIGVSGLVYVSW